MKFVNVLQNKNVRADGVTDDTKALQACIDKVKDGGVVYFPDGTYLISAALIFYSNQTLRFSDKAVLLRSAKSKKTTKYLLASYSEPEWGSYSGTHDTVISGGIFDGNSELTEKLTIINTVHCRNIVIENCRFVHCSVWHCIEINSSENTEIRNCYFDGPSYTVQCEKLRNELIQLDWAQVGAYGPVYNCDGKLIDFCDDETVCKDIKIYSNIFRCCGSPAIGHHGETPHAHIEIFDNIFDGPSGRDLQSRGYIIFQSDVCDVNVHDNFFCAPKGGDSPNLGIVFKNENIKELKTKYNKFYGTVTNRLLQEETVFYED